MSVRIDLGGAATAALVFAVGACAEEGAPVDEIEAAEATGRSGVALEVEEPAGGAMSACAFVLTRELFVAQLAGRGGAVVSATSVEVSATPRTREVAVDDEAFIETVHEVTLRGAIVHSESMIAEPWIVRDLQASIRRLSDGTVLRVPPGSVEQRWDPLTVLRRDGSGPMLVMAVSFGGEATITQVLPISGTEVVLGSGETLPLDEVARLAGGAP